jgi:hypothetical protein
VQEPLAFVFLPRGREQRRDIIHGCLMQPVGGPAPLALVTVVAEAESDVI